MGIFLLDYEDAKVLIFNFFLYVVPFYISLACLLTPLTDISPNSPLKREANLMTWKKSGESFDL